MRQKLFASYSRNRWEITDKMFFSLFLTGVIVEFSHSGAAFFDGLIISRYLGSDAMAAMGITSPVFNIFSIFSGLLAMGMQGRCAHAIGRGNREEYCRFFSATVYVGAVVSLIITVLALVFAQPLAVVLGASGDASELLEPATDYMIAVALCAFPMIMSAILAPALQLDSGRRLIQTGAISGTVINIILDVVAVKMGWGILGVGLVTTFQYYFVFFFRCLFFLKKDRTLHFVKPNVPVKEFLKMMGYGSSTVIKRFFNSARPIILNKIIIFYGGVAAMSVFSIQKNFSHFSFVFGIGIASAVSLLTGVNYGEINEEGISEVNRYEHRMTLYFAGSVCAMLMIFAEQVARLYVEFGSETFPMAVFAIRMNALQLPLQALIESRIRYLQAIRRKRNMNLLLFAQELMFVLLSALVLGRLFGSYGILACSTVGDFLSLFSIYIYYAVKCRKIWPTRKDYLNLPDSFYLHPGNVISLDVRGQDEVSLGSRQISLFCKGHHTDTRTAYYAALSFEELASNIVKYGFPKNRASDPMIDLRVVISDDALVIRLRDNCPKYDVTKDIAAVNEPGSDPLHNIGTRIVSRTASDITYLSTFDTNNLIIRFRMKNNGKNL